MNKSFLPSPENFGADQSCRFREKRQTANSDALQFQSH